MRKVLIISFYFADKTAIGAIRINGLVKSLPKFGWKPFVLTAPSKERYELDASVVEAPYDDLMIKWKTRIGFNVDRGVKEQFSLETQKNNQDFFDSLIYYWYEIFAYPDVFSDWRNRAVELGEKLIDAEGFDAMISSSFPWTCNLIANDLKKKYDLPWIADFRDLWTQSHYYNHLRFRCFFEKRLELKTLNYADALTTVSQPLAEKLKQIHKGKEVYSIPNGFDPDQKNPGIPLSKKFTITYTGALYRGRRDPEPLFMSLSDLISSGLIDSNDLSVEFYGPKEDWLEQSVEKYKLKGVVKIYGTITREDSIEKQRRSHILLLLTWYNPEEKGVYTGKVFDYLAASRPILSIGMSGGVVEDLLKSTGSGVHVSNSKDIEKYILKAYLEYKSGNDVSYNGIPSVIDKKSHFEMAQKFSIILDKLVEGKG